ncbi:MAG: carboxypeptidase-like regulatory domain-containing protein [Bryobacteraceae bacterium]
MGTVVDASGAAIPNARLLVKSMETGITRTTVTNQTGEYLVSNLSLGTYNVEVGAEGFKRAVYAPVTITVKARVRVDATLQVGEVTETLEVSGAAPLIKTDTAEVGGVINRQTLNDVPVFGRHFLSLAALVPGTTSGPRAVNRQRDFSSQSITVGGASAEANNFIIDGISDNMEFSGATGVVPAIDAIQEFAIQTSQYSAEFGRSGGGVVNVAIRSGTNELHGFAYDYLRNDKLDARTFDFTGTNPAKTPVRRNIFGGGLGGPMIKNRLFFFGNYEGTRYPSSSTSTVAVPTALEKSGDFSKSSYIVYDPATAGTTTGATRTAFAGNVIPSSRISSIGPKLLGYYPNPNYTDASTTNNYITSVRNSDNLDAFTIKTDYSASSKDIFMARYSQQRGGRKRSNWMPNDVIGAEASLNATNTGMTYTRIISPTMVNEARIGYNYLRFGNEVLQHDYVLDEFDIPGLPITEATKGYPALSLRKYASASISRPISSVPTPFVLVEHSWQYMDNLSWHKGNHAIKIGGEYGRVANNRHQGQVGGVSMSFQGYYTTGSVGGSLETARTGVPDALLGLAYSYSTTYALDAIRIRSNRSSVFIQDDWRATRRLTLSIGLRWDYFGPYTEEQDRFGNFDYRTGQRVVPSSTRTIVQNVLGFAGGALPSSTWRYGDLSDVVPHANYRDTAPRFGFAYAATKRLVIRGGYGIFYGVTVSNNASNSGTEGSMFFAGYSRCSEIVRPIEITSGFPPSGLAGALSSRTFSAYYTPLDRHDPYTQKYSLNLQYSPSSHIGIELGYSGQRALAFPTLVQGNAALPGSGTLQDRRPYPNVGSFWQFVPVSDSNYNGLEMSFRLKEYHGLAIQSAFTFSKSLGYSQGTDSQSGTDHINNPYDFRWDYGPLSYDFRRRWVSSWTYRIPTPRSLPGYMRHVLGRWDTSGMVTLEGGFPFSVYVSGQIMNNGAGSNRANVLRNPDLPVGERTIKRWFDTDAFSMPANYVWGNQGKGMLRGPGYAVVDFALQKGIPLAERKLLAFRMEATNFFNRVNLGLPSSTLGGSNFGVISSVQGTARNIQLALRLEF